jgi:hypothetical protein
VNNNPSYHNGHQAAAGAVITPLGRKMLSRLEKDNRPSPAAVLNVRQDEFFKNPPVSFLQEKTFSFPGPDVGEKLFLPFFLLL